MSSVEKITIKQYLNQTESLPLLDVRTPAEYLKGHIPGALNLPLFSNQERAEVGTIYKKQSPKEALHKGLEMVGPKLAELVRQAESLCPEKQLVLHCWRGGKRSGSLAWLFNLSGFKVKVILGGYKAYRNELHKMFEKERFHFRVVGGKTGVGKTRILKALEEMGEQVIDLEGLAQHKGSAFGGLGESSQPSTEQFENNLYESLRRLDAQRSIWVENESRLIGSVYLPNGFWQQMKKAPLFNIEIPHPDRIDYLVKDYAKHQTEDLIHCLHKIKKRLGGLHFQQAQEAILNGDFPTAAELILYYYDKTYQYMLDKNTTKTIHRLSFDQSTPQYIAGQLLST